MQSLEEMRKELDVIDDQITTLYERRMKVCEGVAEYKIKNGRKVFDKTRENEKLAAVAEKVSTDFNKKGIRELFEQLMSMSRKLQYQRLSEEGVLGRLPLSDWNSWILMVHVWSSREWKEPTTRQLC